MSKVVPSPMDIEHLRIIRQNIVNFMKHVASVYMTKPSRLLDIAPQVYKGAKAFSPDTIVIETFDIDPKSGCTYIGDICEYNACLADNTYDYVMCTEVLEHTMRPWDAVSEIWRILKPSGFLLLSVPFNFRIHGPLPDCWRFTEHGIRALLNKFVIPELNVIETQDRPLMPIHYTVVAQKPVAVGELQ